MFYTCTIILNISLVSYFKYKTEKQMFFSLMPVDCLVHLPLGKYLSRLSPSYLSSPSPKPHSCYPFWLISYLEASLLVPTRLGSGFVLHIPRQQLQKPTYIHIQASLPSGQIVSGSPGFVIYKMGIIVSTLRDYLGNEMK